VAVASFDYESTMTICAPFLLAASAELPAPRIQMANGAYLLRAEDAVIHGTPHLEAPDGIPNVGYWDSPADFLSWEVELKSAGSYHVVATVATELSDGVLSAELEGSKTQATVPKTGGWQAYTELDLGVLKVTRAGVQSFSLKPVDAQSWKAVNLRSVRLIPQ
jgi:hypothetical protein